ncbi:MAG: CoA ester lyase [Dehalococcoidia bacterium]|nr:CoA ester lyase [Dehalococcoidia bacterium]
MLILRSLIFVPGNQERRIEKALSIPADAVIIDLEDSVPVAEKEAARNMLPGAISRLHTAGKQIFVRVNSLQTPYFVSDMKTAVAGKVTGICLPKSESVTSVRQAEETIAEAERTSGIKAGQTGIIALVETPRGLINVNEIASASRRVIGIAFGAEDYALEMGIERTREGAEIYYPRMVISVACHAANVLAFDSVYTDVRDREGLIAETRAVKQMGFQGKMVIHPDQVNPVNEVFSPSESEVTYARRVVEAFDAGVKRGEASISLDGKMIDIPVAERSRNLLARAGAISTLGKH